MRISDWSSDVCSSDLEAEPGRIEEDGDALLADDDARAKVAEERAQRCAIIGKCGQLAAAWRKGLIGYQAFAELRRQTKRIAEQFREALLHHRLRSEEHTSELQSLMRISYAVFCLKKKKIQHPDQLDINP